MLRYKTAEPLCEIAGGPAEQEAFLGRFQEHYGEALAVLAGLNARNREEDVPGRRLQPYYCIGCDVGDGKMRAEVLGLAAYPLYQVAVQKLLGKQIALQCYFSQTYERQAGPGPGGIIGVLDGRAVAALDTSASRAWKYWRWVDSNLPDYLPEDEAETALWKLSYIAFPRGKAWLMGLPEDLPVDGVGFPSEVAHDLHALLGVAAMQRLVARHLDKDVVLLDRERVTLRRNLRWNVAQA